jgi:hypothetical protein
MYVGWRGSKKMIKIQKIYFFLATFCLLHIILIYTINTISDNNSILTSNQVQEFHHLASQGNATAMSKLIDYYWTAEGFNKAVEVFRGYKDVSCSFKKWFCWFLMFGNEQYQNEIISLTIELANEGDYYAQRDLANFYAIGRFVEKDLQKAEYWTKISKCNKKGISIQECEEKLKQ